MILSDREIILAMEQKRLIINEPPDLSFMDSTAVDLRLDGTLDQWVFPEPKRGLGQTDPKFCPGVSGFKFADLERDFTKPVDIPAQGFDLPPSFKSDEQTGPAHFILGWTMERIYLPHTSRLCARVEGKSSLGRMGLGVHVTAPTIHAGFGFNDKGGTRLRLEIWNVGPLPIQLMKGMRICQLIVEEVREVPIAGYDGDFNLQGPKPAKK